MSMGPFSLHSLPAVSRLPASPRRAAMERFSGHQPSTFPTSSSSSSNRRYLGPDAGNAVFISSRPLASAGSLQVATGSNPINAESIEQEINFKDNDLVFVAGATGRVGSRTVRELLRLGFRVRAGVRSAPRAETLVQSVKQMKLDDAVGNAGTQPAERLEIVECDLENQDGIGPAIGSASIVICCIGASEKEVFDVTGPYRIDFQATKKLIEAATLAKINHFILLTSLGTNKIGFPAAILNLFWGVLIWKRKAEEALIASGLPYTIVRPGGMERPTDSYKETHNIILANEDIYFGGQVSNLQVAELMAFMARNRRISQYKVVEVIAETTAPLTPMEVLLAKIPPQRKLQAESSQDPVPPSIESEPTKSIAEEESKQMKVLKERPLSPYAMYDDFKPPTSPSPNAPITTSVSKPVTDGAAVDESRGEEPNKQEKPRPLSPFTMYDDLKPPTSPVPSVPKH